MSLEVETFLGMAQRRTELIGDILQKGQVYMPAEEEKTSLVRSIFQVVTELDIKGQENIEEAWELVNKGKKLLITSNHQSDADHDAKRYVLERLGLGKFAQRIFFLGGLKMLEREETRVFIPSENLLLVATPQDKQNMKEVARLLGKGLTGQQETIFLEYVDKMGALSAASSGEYRRLIALGMVPLFYPEATRSRDEMGRMMRAQREVISLIPNEEETYILPWVTDGTLNIMTIEDKLKFEPTKLVSVCGRIYATTEIFQTKREGIYLDGSAASYADVIMGRLALAKPDLVKAEDLAFYQKLCPTYNPREEGALLGVGSRN